MMEIERKINNVVRMCLCIEKSYEALTARIKGNEETQHLVAFSEYLTFCGVRTRILAEKWLKYLVVRGMEIQLDETKTIQQESVEMTSDSNQCMLESLQVALKCEMQLEQNVRELYFLAREKNDMLTTQGIEAGFLAAQYSIIRWIVGNLNKLIASDNQQFIHEKFTYAPMVLSIGKMIESGELNKCPVFQDKIVMLMLETTWLQMNHSQPIEDAQSGLAQDLFCHL
ncbi:hypothetical protein Ciccas_008952 [Cichlidogyrus casuarinus]|uniref:Uncharacterized protein n=1 Tax=Cichlidogyrus casuarinus TaxID=1844966 RepID=A0ABD2PYF3_9PLAT